MKWRNLDKRFQELRAELEAIEPESGHAVSQNVELAGKAVGIVRSLIKPQVLAEAAKDAEDAEFQFVPEIGAINQEYR